MHTAEWHPLHCPLPAKRALLQLACGTRRVVAPASGLNVVRPSHEKLAHCDLRAPEHAWLYVRRAVRHVCTAGASVRVFAEHDVRNVGAYV